MVTLTSMRKILWQVMKEIVMKIEKELNDIKGKKKMFKFSGQIRSFSDFLMHKSEKPQNRIEFKFKFSNFQAFQLQVPKGWDKLFVSIVSVETGKCIAKSGKAMVQNGSCRWEETLLESMWISHNNAIVPKNTEECLFKLVVAMGSQRFGTLGEAIVNLASYTDSKTCQTIQLALKKCYYGTVLQVTIQCLTPRTNLSDEESEDSSSDMEEMNVMYDDIDHKSSEISDGILKRSRSSFVNRWDNTNHAGEHYGT